MTVIAKKCPAATVGEQAATRADAKRRLAELIAVRALLWPDRDDALVICELTSVQSQVNACERELGIQGTQCP
jgi:hypothetical protein